MLLGGGELLGPEGKKDFRRGASESTDATAASQGTEAEEDWSVETEPSPAAPHRSSSPSLHGGAEGGESAGTTPSARPARGDSRRTLPSQLREVVRKASRHSAHSGDSLGEQCGTVCCAAAPVHVRAASAQELFATSPPEIPAVGGCLGIEKPHSQHLLPAEVVLFEPSQQEIFFEGDATGGHRQIFLNTPLTEEEQQALSRLHEALQREAERHGYAAGRFPNFMRLHALRMLQQSRYDISKTVALMQTHLTERVARLPISEADVLDDLHSGFMYWHGRDRKCRPCLVIRLERLGEMAHDRERAVRLVLFVLEYAIRFALAPGRVENWVVVMDLTNALSLISPLHMTGMASTAVTLGVALEKVYAGRMVWMKIVNMPGSSIVRRIVDGAIPADKKKKVSFPSESELAAEMAAEFEPNQVERQYGGAAPDLEAGETYPFRFLPDCRGQGEAAGGSLHALSTRALHEGCLWDESLPETRAEWLRQARASSLTPQAAQAASELLERQGEPPVAPCRDLSEWLGLADSLELGERSARRFEMQQLRKSDSPRSVRRPWF